MLTNQNQIHILTHKLIHIFMHTDTIYLQQKAAQMLRGEHSTWSIGDTYQAQMSGTHPKRASKCPGGGKGGGGELNNFRISNLGKQIRHTIIRHTINYLAKSLVMALVTLNNQNPVASYHCLSSSMYINVHFVPIFFSASGVNA